MGVGLKFHCYRRMHVTPKRRSLFANRNATHGFDDSWFPCISDSYGEKSDIRINKDQFSKIVHGNRPVGEIVLGACVWYPWNDDDGKLYIEILQKLIPIPFHRIGVTKLILVLATMGY